MQLSPKVKRICFGLVYGLFLLTLGECGARGFWITRGVPFLSSHSRLHWAHYAGLAELERNRVADDEECFEILLLGGSVLHRDYGDIEQLLLERLTRKSGACVRIHNLAAAAQTSLDSRNKYSLLDDQHFDLVVFYHGINEARANNCDRNVFRDDYSHLSWYRLVNQEVRGARSRWFVLPYTVEFVTLKVLDRLGWLGSIPIHRPELASTKHGCDVKTAKPFRSNLDSIRVMAEQRGEPLLVMSFASYLAEGYSEELFESRSLDYTAHTFATELWGDPKCVVAAIAAHNQVVRDVAREHDTVRFIDQASLIPHEGTYFNDICHLTHEGCERFVENMVEVVSDVMKSRP